MLRLPGITEDSNLRKGQYDLMRIFEDTMIINYTEPSQPAKIFCVRFKAIEAEQTLDQLLDASNLEVNLLEQIDFESVGDEFGQFYSEKVRSTTYDMIKLDNGAEAMFIRSADLDPSKKHPMLLVIHGGPFSASPYQMFLGGRQLLMM